MNGAEDVEGVDADTKLDVDSPHPLTHPLLPPYADGGPDCAALSLPQLSPAATAPAKAKKAMLRIILW